MIQIRKAAKSFRYALSGLRIVLREENNARIHLVASGVVFASAYLLGFSAVEWAILSLVVSSVWISEIMNSAVERLVNSIYPNRDERAGAIKDISAGGVLVAVCFAVVVGIILFLPKLIRLT